MNTHQEIDTIDEQAAHWLIILRKQHFSLDDPNRDPAVRNAAFFAWLKRSPAHLMIFMEMMELERRFKRLGAESSAQIRELVEDAQRGSVHIDVSAPENLPALTANEPAFKPRRSPYWISLAVAAAIGAVAVIVRSPSEPGYIYSTPVGGQHEYVMDDGSKVKLNTDSQVEVRYSDRARLVKLNRGEAYFSVKPDYRRPFTVLAGEGRIWDLGTEFNVRLRANSTTVAVISGKVEVGTESVLSNIFNASPRWNLDGGVRLSSGQAVEVVNNRVVDISGSGMSDATAWLDGRLVFRKTRLDEAVAEFNRYNVAQIVIVGESAQETPVSGIFNSDRCQDFLTYVKTLPLLSVTQEGNRWVIRSQD